MHEEPYHKTHSHSPFCLSASWNHSLPLCRDVDVTALFSYVQYILLYIYLQGGGVSTGSHIRTHPGPKTRAMEWVSTVSGLSFLKNPQPLHKYPVLCQIRNQSWLPENTNMSINFLWHSHILYFFLANQPTNWAKGSKQANKVVYIIDKT